MKWAGLAALSIRLRRKRSVKAACLQVAATRQARRVPRPPDGYEFMQPELVALLEAKVGKYLRRLAWMFRA